MMLLMILLVAMKEHSDTDFGCEMSHTHEANSGISNSSMTQ